MFAQRMVIDEPIMHKEELGEGEEQKKCCFVRCLSYLPNKYRYERIPCEY